jgi:hypothetical protein
MSLLSNESLENEMVYAALVFVFMALNYSVLWENLQSI